MTGQTVLPGQTKFERIIQTGQSDQHISQGNYSQEDMKTLLVSFQDRLKTGDSTAAREILNKMRDKSYPSALINSAEKELSLIEQNATGADRYNTIQLPDIRSKELKAYGAAVLGPSLYLFYRRLTTKTLYTQERHPNLYFLAREGYLLQKGYNAISKLMQTSSQSRYLIISRVLMFRALLEDPRSFPLICSHNFSGSLERLLVSRCGLTHEEICSLDLSLTLFPQGLETSITLPADTSRITQLIEQNSKTIKIYSSTTREIYLEYLSELGLLSEERIHIVDLGYSGTIQKSLGLLTGKAILGHYFITTPAAKDTRCNKFVGHLFSNRGWGTGCTLLDRSLILEALLTAPTGSAQGVHRTCSGIQFNYGPTTKAQDFFKVLELVFDGALSYCINSYKQQASLSPAEVNELYQLTTCPKNSSMPKDLRFALEVEDSFSGLGTINPNSLYSNQQ